MKSVDHVDQFGPPNLFVLSMSLRCITGMSSDSLLALSLPPPPWCRLDNCCVSAQRRHHSCHLGREGGGAAVLGPDKHWQRAKDPLVGATPPLVKDLLLASLSSAQGSRLAPAILVLSAPSRQMLPKVPDQVECGLKAKPAAVQSVHAASVLLPTFGAPSFARARE